MLREGVRGRPTIDARAGVSVLREGVRGRLTVEPVDGVLSYGSRHRAVYPLVLVAQRLEVILHDVQHPRHLTAGGDR